MQRILEHAGHATVLAEDGVTALRMLSETEPAHLPDLIVLDVMMPVLDGWTVLTRLKEHAQTDVRSVPVLMLTALHEPQAEARGGIEGAVRWLTKPFKIDELVGAVESALNEPEAVQRQRARKRALEQLARLEKGGTGAVLPAEPAGRRPRLTALERPQISPARLRRDAVLGALDRLTDTQRRTVETVATQSVSDAASALGVSRSSVYATLRRCARRLGVDSVSDLLAALRPPPGRDTRRRPPRD